MIENVTTHRRFERVLIANRGEVAVRIARTLRHMGISPIAVYTDVDRASPHVRVCDAACCIGAGPADASYLRADAILAAAEATRADAIHPGYGFLSERAEFAEAVANAGLRFIGPSADALRLLGSKTAARRTMQAAGVPVVPGSLANLEDEDELLRTAREIGMPLMLKAADGGGGRGIRPVTEAGELLDAFRAARAEATKAFGSGSIYLEKLISDPRHIEVQIVADGHGHVYSLGERECSMQRRHQKLIEESPSAVIDPATRESLGDWACRAARSVGLVGLGTVEFLRDSDGQIYFLEVNPRLQVEHPVTEMRLGLDLVELQVRIAQGEAVLPPPDGFTSSGHAIECRICAEDPDSGFAPSPGRITTLELPGGPGVRVDCGVMTGLEVSLHYDALLAKLVVHGRDRAQALRRMEAALDELVIEGPRTNLAFLRRLVRSPAFRDGRYHTGTVAEVLAQVPSVPSPIASASVVALAVDALGRVRRTGPRRAASASFTVRVADETWPVSIREEVPGRYEVRLDGRTAQADVVPLGERRRSIILDLAPFSATIERPPASPARVEIGCHAVAVDLGDSREEALASLDPQRERDQASAAATIRWQMPGTVAAVLVSEGQRVTAGQVLVVVESMKMQCEVRAPSDGVVRGLSARPGTQVHLGMQVCVIDAAPDRPPS